MSLASLLGLQRPEENGAQNLSKKFSDLCFEKQIWPKDPLDVDTIEALCNFNLQQRLEWIHEIKKDRSVSSFFIFSLNNEESLIFFILTVHFYPFFRFNSACLHLHSPHLSNVLVTSMRNQYLFLVQSLMRNN